MPSEHPALRPDRPGHDGPGRPSADPSGPVDHPVRHRLTAIAGLLAIAYLGLTAIWTGLGLLLTGPLAGTAVDAMDRDVADRLVERRTPQLDGWSQAGSMLAETLVKVIATAVIAVVLLIVLRSWREPFLISFALTLEAAVFITVTWLVGRPRPEVAPLDDVSVGTSFPSGHVAAAAAYAAVAVVILERTRSVWIRTGTVAVAVLLPIVVGVSRMYRGVHYLTDVVGGAGLGAVCVLVTYLIARRVWR